MAKKDFIFGALSPDLGGLAVAESPVYLADADQVRPTPAGYRIYPGQTAMSNGSVGVNTGNSIESHYAPSADDSTSGYVFAGGGDTLFVRDVVGSTWYNVSPSSAPTSPARWEFQQYEELLIVAASTANSPYRKSLTDAISTVFTPLGGSPPKAAHIGRIGQHVLLGNLENAPFTVQWCAIDDPEDWPTPLTEDARSKQAGSQIFPHEYGSVRGIATGEKFGLVFQETAVHRLTYVGGDIVFDIDTLTVSKGQAKEATGNPIILQADKLTYFMDANGFYATDGFEITELSEGVIKDTYFRDIGTLPATSAWSPYYGGFDPVRRALWFKSFLSTSFNLVYHIDQKAFTTSSMECVAFFQGGQTGANPNDRFYTFKDGAGATADFYEVTDGTGIAMAIQTGYIELNPGAFARLQRVQLIGANEAASINVYYDAQKDPMALNLDNVNSAAAGAGYTAMTTPNRSFTYTANADGRYFAFRIEGTVDETALFRGLRIWFDPAEEL